MTRERFPVVRELAYLNAGSCGPLAADTVAAMRVEEDAELAHGRGGSAHFEHVRELRARARELFAQLLDVDPLQVALTSSTSDGCQVVLAGLDLGPDDEVVTTDDEHFGLLGPLGATRARIRPAETNGRGGEAALEAILAEVGSRTRLVALSHVFWTSGNRVDLDALAAAVDVPILVDGAQSVGALPVRGDAVDFLTVSGQKWLCGPDATGALVVRDPEALRAARPTYLSQDGYEHDGSFVPRPGAARFDTTFTGAPALAGLIHALESRPADAFDRCAAAAAQCRARLAERFEVVTDPDQSGLVSWRDADAPATAARLAEAGVVIRDLPGRDLLRASCGWWTSEGDVARLLAAL
jgi:L-cysteine/cystine lyase